MNKLKRISCVLFSFCLIISFVSCRKDNADEDVSDDSSIVQTADNITNNEIKLLSVNKEFVSHYEWCEDFSELLVKSEYSDVTLDKSVEEKYPTLAKKLSETSAMRKRLMEDEKDNFIAFANEEIKRDSEAFSTYVSTLDVQVRRADSVVVSILEDCYSDGRRAFNGINYDTESGKELALSDVFTDTSNIASAVEKELMSRDMSRSYSDIVTAVYELEKAVNDININYNAFEDGSAGKTITPVTILLAALAIAAVSVAEIYVYKKKKK